MRRRRTRAPRRARDRPGALEAVGRELAQRAHVLVPGVADVDRHRAAAQLVDPPAVPAQRVVGDLGERAGMARPERVAHLERLLDHGRNALGVEVGVGDGREEPFRDAQPRFALRLPGGA